MFVNIFDVPEDGGPLSVVPGSHLLPFNPWEIFGKSFKSSLTLDAELAQEQMPVSEQRGSRASLFRPGPDRKVACAQNHVKFAAPAGTALLFDTSCWHTPMPNTSAAPRRVYNAGFAASSGGQATTPWDIAELIPPARLTERLARLIGADTSQLLGTPAGTPRSYQR